MGKASHGLALPSVVLGLFPFALVLTGGCDDGLPDPPGVTATPPSDLAVSFDPATTGTIRGRVTWEGKIPQVPPFVKRPCPFATEGLRERLVRDNPNAPDVDPSTRTVRGAVVFLRGIDVRRACPWDLPPVRVELRDRDLHVLQGEALTRVGVVRVGDTVEMASRDALFHSLNARGAAFFGVAFPDAGQPLSRRLDRPGVVELSSGAGYYWMRGYLFVGEHPYYTRTDATGRFEFRQVPSGCYDIVCWLPDWREARHERDPDTALISRLVFRQALEQVRAARVNPGEAVAVDFVVSNRSFLP